MAVVLLRDAMMKKWCEMMMMHKILLLQHCPSIFLIAMMTGIIPCSSAAAVTLTINYRMHSSPIVAWVHISVGLDRDVAPKVKNNGTESIP